MTRITPVLAVLIFVCGCSTIHPLTSTQRDAVLAGSNSIVLVRITGEREGQHLPPRQAARSLSKQIVKIAGRMGNSPHNLYAGSYLYATSSREADTNGWMYCILPPGSYAFTGSKLDALLRPVFLLLCLPPLMSRSGARLKPLHGVGGFIIWTWKCCRSTEMS